MSLSFGAQEAKQENIKMDAIPDKYQQSVRECIPVAEGMKEGASMRFEGEQSHHSLLSAPTTPSRSAAASQQIGT